MEYRHPENFISLWLHSREQNGTRNTTVTWQFICAAVPGAGIRCPPPCCCSRWPRTTTPCPRSETWGAVQHVTSEFQTVQNSHVNQRFHLSLGTWRWKCLTWEASLERTMFPVNWPGVNQNGKSGTSLSWNSAWILIRKIHESEVKFCIYLRKKLTTDCQYISKCCKNGANKHLFAQNLLCFLVHIFRS